MMRALSIVVISLAFGCGQSAKVASLPVADAGFDRVVAVDADVRLDGSGSYDPTGATLTYTWRLVSRPAASNADLVAETTAEARVRPDEPGTYLISLVVNNGDRPSEPDWVSVRATGLVGNVAPTADARCIEQTCPAGVTDCEGFTCWVGHGNSGSLDGRRSSDPNGDSLTYTWQQVLPGDCATECPELPSADCATVSDVVTPSASADERVWDYTASAALGKLTFELTVFDGELSDSECVSIDSINFAPRAIVAQSPKTAIESTPFTLDGSGSGDSDPPDTTLTYAWTHEPAGPTVTYSPDANVASPEITVSGLSTDTDLTFVLTVSDSGGKSSTCETADLASCVANCCGIVVSVSDASCTADSQCSPPHCECIDSTCSERVCAAADCVCGWGPGGTCTNNLTSGTEDPEDCEGGVDCNAGGNCN